MAKIFIDHLVLPELDKSIKEAMEILENEGKRGNYPNLWEGKAAERIVEFIENKV